MEKVDYLFEIFGTSDLNSIYAILDFIGPSGFLGKSNAESFTIKQAFGREICWAIPSKVVIKQLSDFIGSSKCLEVCSGRGLWAKLLQLSGSHVTATDSFASDLNMKTFTEVEKLNAIAAVEKYHDHDILMVCWAHIPFEIPQNFKGNKIIFIGEEDGCTSNPPDERFWKKTNTHIDYKPMIGLYDMCLIFERK